MGSRERKRAERRKRKRRSSERVAGEPAGSEAGEADGSPPPTDLATRAQARAEARNQAARDELEPLGEGERPLVVTIGAVVAGVICLSIVVAYAFGAEVDGERPNFAQVAAPAVLMGITAWGMWHARYWAVLGFQVVLLFLIIAAALGLVRAGSAVQVVGNTVLIAASGAFFYFMVKALARIQMPQRRPRG